MSWRLRRRAARPPVPRSRAPQFQRLPGFPLSWTIELTDLVDTERRAERQLEWRAKHKLAVLRHYALTRTSWGRLLFAVGGNKEAARRAGIRVGAVYTSAFIVCPTLAAVGGLLAAERLASAAQSSGGGDVNLNAIAAAVIGSTSLFGGRGSAFAALISIPLHIYP